MLASDGKSMLELCGTQLPMSTLASYVNLFSVDCFVYAPTI